MHSEPAGYDVGAIHGYGDALHKSALHLDVAGMRVELSATGRPHWARLRAGATLEAVGYRACGVAVPFATPGPPVGV